MKGKKVFWKDEMNYRKIQSNVSRVLPLLQSIVDQFAQLGIQLTSIDEIIELLDSHRILNHEKLIEKLIDQLYAKTAKGHWFDREGFKKLVQLPDTSKLVEAFELLAVYHDAPGWRDIVYFSVYKLNSGTVEVDENELEKISSLYYATIDTEEEAERLKAVNELCKHLDRLAELSVPGQDISVFGITCVAQFNSESKKYEAADQFVKTGKVSGNILFGNKPAASMKSSPSPTAVSSGADDDESISAANAAKARNQK